MSNIYLGQDNNYYVGGGNGKVPCKDGCTDAKAGLMKQNGIVPGVRCGFCGTHWIKLENSIYLDPDPRGQGLPEGWEWVEKDGRKIKAIRSRCMGSYCNQEFDDEITPDEATDPHPCPFAEEIHDDHTTLCTCCTECTRECAYEI